jgi:hypothetical protein
MLDIYESVNLPTEVSKPSFDIKTIADWMGKVYYVIFIFMHKCNCCMQKLPVY